MPRLLASWPLALAIGIAIGPALWFGPLLPLLDSLVFAALHSYPARQSAGPDHYYVFAYTYLLPHLVSRAMADFGCGVITQTLLFFLGQAVLYLTMLHQMLRRWIPRPELAALALVAGVLSFWDCLFLWGGPLAFSWAGLLWLAAAWVCFGDAAGERARPGLFLLLTIAALVSHPLAVVAILPLAALRPLFVRERRLASAAAFAVLVLYTLLILRDNPEPGTGVTLGALFGLAPAEVLANLGRWFTDDGRYIHAVFGILPRPLEAVLLVYAAIRAAGWAATPWLLWRHRADRAAVFALVLNLAALAACLAARDNEWVNQWPKRMVSFTGGWSFAVGAWALAEAASRLPRPSAPAWLPRAAALALAPLLIAVQPPILSLGRVLRGHLDSLRASLAGAPIEGSLLRFAAPEISAIEPAYLRAAPFLLFSDATILNRDALVHTEWHDFGRHNSRLAADYPARPRPQKTLRFSLASGQLRADLPVLAPPVRHRLAVRFGSQIPARLPGAPLLATGAPGDANILSVISPAPGQLQFVLDRWGQLPLTSPVLLIDPDRPANLDLAYDRDAMVIRFEDREVFRAQVPLRSLTAPRLGENPFGGTSAEPRFPGTLTPR